jgi:hypothetical protein
VIVTTTLCVIALVAFGVVPPVDGVRLYMLGLIGFGGALGAARALSRFGRLERLGGRSRIGHELRMPAFFEGARRRIELASASGVYFEQLRPRRREIAEQRLAAQGVRLGTERSRELLDDHAADALQRRPPTDKFAPPPEGQLRHVIEGLERL